MNKTMTRIAAAVRDHKHLSTALYHVWPQLDGSVEVRYRGTQVARIAGPTVRLYAGGWRTVTTKRVINAALDGAGSAWSVYQKRGSWYVTGPLYTQTQDFVDGMEVTR